MIPFQSSRVLLAVMLLLVARPLGAAPAQASVVRLPVGALQPQALTTASGDVHVFHLAGDPKQADVVHRLLKAGSTNWTEPVRLNSPGGPGIAVGTVRGVQAALGRDGRLHVVWNGSGTAAGHGGSPFFYTRSSADGRSFEPERDVIDSTDHLDGGGSVAADGAGNVHVVWHGSPKGTAGEPTRRIFFRKSTDDGKTFSAEAALAGADPGVCGCCGLKASATGDGGIAVLYRAAVGGMERGMTLLTGTSDGAFRRTIADPWRTGSCPMSTASLATGRVANWAAWESEGRIRFAPVNQADPVILETDRAAKPTQKHPSLAVNREGAVLVVWMEGTGWSRGGDVVWQTFDAGGKALAPAQRGGTLPVWGSAAAATRGDGGFLVIY